MWLFFHVYGIIWELWNHLNVILILTFKKQNKYKSLAENLIQGHTQLYNSVAKIESGSCDKTVDHWISLSHSALISIVQYVKYVL